MEPYPDYFVLLHMALIIIYELVKNHVTGTCLWRNIAILYD